MTKPTNEAASQAETVRPDVPAAAVSAASPSSLARGIDADAWERMVEAAAKEIADSPLIDAPKLKYPSWMGLARSALEAALGPSAASPAATALSDSEAAQFLDDGFSIKVLNAAPEGGYNKGRNYWRCPHCQMADFDGHEQSCIIRTLVERLLGRHVPFGTMSADTSSATAYSDLHDKAMSLPTLEDLRTLVKLPEDNGVHVSNLENVYKDARQIIIGLLDARSAPAPTSACKDWKLVPVEPTNAMLEALFGGGSDQQVGEKWDAMLAAAPSAPIASATGRAHSTERVRCDYPACGKAENRCGVCDFKGGPNEKA